MKQVGNKSKQPLAVKAYQQITERIIKLEYAPGQGLEEKPLMEELGLGRTPIREALLRLAGEKMVESHPGKGFLVPPITLQKIKSTFEMIKLLEAGVAELMVRYDLTPFLEGMEEAHEAVREAIENKDVLGMVEANHRFHQNYAKCSCNEYLINSIEEVRSEAKRLSYLSYSNELGAGISLNDHYQSVIRDHRQIIDLLKNKDTEKLKNIVLSHAQAFQKRIVLFMGA
ncbi:MAG: GntR family transcriptional regulator [Desulfobacterales bacterium]|nr:GntR family transcriptional regulator [Desulfobacterales bacterium]